MQVADASQGDHRQLRSLPEDAGLKEKVTLEGWEGCIHSRSKALVAKGVLAQKRKVHRQDEYGLQTKVSRERLYTTTDTSGIVVHSLTLQNIVHQV